jgi:hypothetical protein
LKMIALLASLIVHAPAVGAGQNGWRFCDRSSGLGFSRNATADQRVVSSCPPAASRIMAPHGGLILRGGREKGEVEGDSESDNMNLDDDPMANNPPPDRMRYTGGVNAARALVVPSAA